MSDAKDKPLSFFTNFSEIVAWLKDDKGLDKIAEICGITKDEVEDQLKFIEEEVCCGTLKTECEPVGKGGVDPERRKEYEKMMTIFEDKSRMGAGYGCMESNELMAESIAQIRKRRSCESKADVLVEKMDVKADGEEIHPDALSSRNEFRLNKKRRKLSSLSINFFNAFGKYPMEEKTEDGPGRDELIARLEDAKPCSIADMVIILFDVMRIKERDQLWMDIDNKMRDLGQAVFSNYLRGDYHITDVSNMVIITEIVALKERLKSLERIENLCATVQCIKEHFNDRLDKNNVVGDDVYDEIVNYLMELRGSVFGR